MDQRRWPSQNGRGHMSPNHGPALLALQHGSLEHRRPDAVDRQSSSQSVRRLCAAAALDIPVGKAEALLFWNKLAILIDFNAVS